VTRSTSRLAALAFGTLLLASSISAGEDCGKLFPDLTCDRSGRFEGFEMPIVQPYLFEDPFITTGVYPYYVWHQFPNDSPLEGGEANLVAAQIRVAVTDRLAIIATKDGYMWKDPGNPLLKNTGGWMNLGFGAKYAVYQNRDAGRIVSLALKYEASSGAKDSFQNEGDGMLMPSITGAARLGDFALQGDVGGSWAIDDSQSSSIYYHLYAAYPLIGTRGTFSPFLQLSGMHWVSSGDGSRLIELSAAGQAALSTQYVPIGAVEALYNQRFEGADVANLGSVGVDGLDYLTMAFGVHVRFLEHVTVSAAYEVPVSHHESITRQRITTSMAWEF
jgi:hypothetical protein